LSVQFYQQYREEIIDLFSRYRLRVLPVVDIDDHLLGVIRQSTITAISGNILTNALNNCSLDPPFEPDIGTRFIIAWLFTLQLRI